MFPFDDVIMNNPYTWLYFEAGVQYLNYDIYTIVLCFVWVFGAHFIKYSSFHCDAYSMEVSFDCTSSPGWQIATKMPLPRLYNCRTMGKIL